MPGHGLQFRSLGRGERLALVPGVVGGRYAPEVALRVAHDPLLTGLVHVEGHDALACREHPSPSFSGSSRRFTFLDPSIPVTLSAALPAPLPGFMTRLLN